MDVSRERRRDPLQDHDTAGPLGPRDQPEVPVCVGCLRPVERVADFCPHCGAAVGDFTALKPLEYARLYGGLLGRAAREGSGGAPMSLDDPFQRALLRFMAVVTLPLRLLGVPVGWLVAWALGRRRASAASKGT